MFLSISYYLFNDSRFTATKLGVAAIVTKLEFLSSEFLEEVISSVSPQSWWVFHKEKLPEEMIDVMQ